MTYSIVARCPETGELGVAVQSAFVAVGNRVPWVRAGVGAIATQAAGNVAYGPQGLDLLHQGLTPSEVVARLTSEDDGRETRQLGIVGPDRAVGAYTGSECIDYAGHVVLKDAVVLANLMTSSGVPEAMAASWTSTEGRPLWSRLLDALDAAELAGGDLRGRQAACLKVASGEKFDNYWEGTTINVRVDDHLQPVSELRRILEVSRAFSLASEGERLMDEEREEEAHSRFDRALELAPNHGYLKFRKAMALAQSDPEESDATFIDLRQNDSRWETFRNRMRKTPGDES